MKNSNVRKTAKRNSRKKSNSGAVWLLIAFLIMCIWLFSTFILKTTDVQFESSKVKDEITIVQLTDLHGADFGLNNASIIKRVKKAEPDLVVVTGDMYTTDSEDGKKTALKLMKKLSESYTVLFVNGEHDNDESFFADLRECGVDVLDYKYRDFTIRGTEIRVYGITNVYFTPTFDLKNEFTLDDGKYNILISHICNEDAFASFGLDLCIAGDTHGGQVRLPFVGGLYGTTGWFPELKNEKEFIKGKYELADTDFFISSGLGNYPLPIRFLNQPEVAVIKIEGEKSQEK